MKKSKYFSKTPKHFFSGKKPQKSNGYTSRGEGPIDDKSKALAVHLQGFHHGFDGSLWKFDKIAFMDDT